MDIKSRNFKYSYFVKAIAVILMFALVFSAGFTAFSLYRSKLIFADDGKNDLISTPSFLYNISNDLGTISELSSFNKSMIDNADDFILYDYRTHTSIDNINSDRQFALELFDIIQEFKKLAPETDQSILDSNEISNSNSAENNEKVDRFEIINSPQWSKVALGPENPTYGGSSYTRAQSVKISDAQKYLTKKYSDYYTWYDDYQLLRRYLYNVVYDATSHDTINNEFDSKISGIINDNRENFLSSYNWYKINTDNMVNLKFVLVRKDSGEIITNIKQENFNLDSFRSSLNDSLFHINYSATDGLIDGGVPQISESTSTIVELFGYTFGAPTANAFNNSYLSDYFGNEFDAYIMIPKQLERGDVYHYLYQNYVNSNDSSPLSLPAIVLIFLLSLIPVIYLVIVAGRKTDDSLSLAYVDKIPVIIHLLLSSIIIFFLFFLIGVLCSFEFNNAFYDTSLYIILSAVYSAVPVAAGVLLGISGLVLLELVLSITRLLKKKEFFNNTLLHYIFKFIKFIARMLAFPFTASMKRKIIWGIIGYIFANSILAIICGALLNAGFASFFLFFIVWAAVNVFAFVMSVKYISGFNTIARVAAEMKSGNYEVPLNVHSLPESLRKTAEDLLDVRSSIQLAVNEKLKGERMKTELITNVSHDLKTPLTSIINYVDLLKKCNIEDEDVNKYLEVLDEKSNRLKRLIEDLTEASKASTGNIKINPVPIDLSELALQALGEHDDALESVGLEAVFNTQEIHPIVYGDSQQTWRIIDNLFSNARKYAQKGTRIYVDVFAENGYGIFSMKNISSTPLNMPASELTERFVRGDSSRTGEGSGLGLSIAQSLCEIQSGKFVLDIDGDLFKATVKLPLYAVE